MRIHTILSMTACALLVSGLILNATQDLPEAQATATEAAPAPESELGALSLPEFDPTSLLFAISGDAHDVHPLQGMPGTRPPGWEPDPPLDLSGPMPSDDDIRAAIVRGVDYILSLQQETGAWNEVLAGTVMSQAADQAVDQIAATSLAGIALRYHVAVNPPVVEEACRRAADFIMDRVYRGKLATQIWYANWRYTLGLQFLHMEWKATSDAERKAEIEAVCRRMINALLRMQMSNSEGDLLERRQRARIGGRFRDSAKPTTMGLVLALPTDEKYRGGAPVVRVVEGSAADRAGIRAGDVITSAESMRIENAVDYYMQETEWVGGQRIRLVYQREGRSQQRDITLDQTWPGYIGLELVPHADGLEVKGFRRFSPVTDLVEVGDIITELDGTEVKTVAEFAALERQLQPGRRARMRLQRGRRARAVNVTPEAAPMGWLAFRPEEEDVEGGDGVIINLLLPQGPVGRAGMEIGDRLTWIGDTPIIGLDHFVDLNLPGGVEFEIRWERNGEERRSTITTDVVVMRGDPQFSVQTDNLGGRAIVSDVKQNGIAHRADIRQNDVVISINGRAVRNALQYYQLSRGLAAGDEVTYGLRRLSRDFEVSLTLERMPPPEVEEGGWAYYPNMGVSPSFSTASALVVLHTVQGDLKLRIPRDSIRSACNLIESLRINCPNHAGEETYIYTARNRQDPRSQDLRGCMGRNTVCELALALHGQRRRNHVQRQIDNFMRHRGELDAVRRMEFYNPPGRQGSPHNYDRWHNAAYYWMYGHYYTLQAAKWVGGRTMRDVNEMCVKAIMATRLDDGTWIDHPSFGPLIGTGLALWVLGETEGAWREDYKVPTQRPTTRDRDN